MNWINIKDKQPPFDVKVLVRGYEEVEFKYMNGFTKDVVEGKDTVTHYAIAFNECYPPSVYMSHTERKIPILDRNIDFDIDSWCELESERSEE